MLRWEVYYFECVNVFHSVANMSWIILSAIRWKTFTEPDLVVRIFLIFFVYLPVHYEHLHVMFTCEQCIHSSDSTNTPALIYFFTSLFVHYIDPGCLCSAVVMESVSSDQKWKWTPEVKYPVSVLQCANHNHGSGTRSSVGQMANVHGLFSVYAGYFSPEFLKMSWNNPQSARATLSKRANRICECTLL